MGKHKFDRKKSVRFTLVPGPEKEGKPSVLFKPVQTNNIKLKKKQKKKIISEFSDYDQITINGKVMEEDEIPAYVLDQIRGRKDLLFNELKGNMGEQEEQVGDLYQIQDGVDDGQFQKGYDLQMDEEEIIKEERERDEYDEQDEEWSDYGSEDEDDMEEEQIVETKPGKKIEQKQEDYETKEEEFPTLEELQTVNIQGKQYQLTKKQVAMLDTVLPQNYENLNIGIDFQKYDEDGLPLSQKQNYEKYLLKDTDKVGIIDTYQYVPSKPVDVVDTDIDDNLLKKEPELKEIEDALNYDGDDGAYEEIQDDFFAKMIQGELADGGDKKKKNEEKKVEKKQKKKEEEVKKEKVKVMKVTKKEQIPEKQLDEELEKAMFNFQNNIDDKKQSKQVEEDSQSQEQFNSNDNSVTVSNYIDLDNKQEYRGKDGELDWRMLTKKQKKLYMKTKVIRQDFDLLRQRQIQEKIRGKVNVEPEQLHLKQIVQHIPYSEDHAMQKTLEQGLKQNNEEDEEDYESLSSQQDDIVSFHQKTSIIATNLSVIEQPHKQKKKKEKKQDDEQSQCNITKIKVVPQRRNRKETSAERKQRKNKLKEMKKEKKEQKKQFAQRFTKIKKDHMKNQNHTNPLKGVSYVKIY